MVCGCVCTETHASPGLGVVRAVIKEVVDGVIVELHVGHKHSVVSVLINCGACLADFWNTQDVPVLWHLSTGMRGNMEVDKCELTQTVRSSAQNTLYLMHWETLYITPTLQRHPESPLHTDIALYVTDEKSVCLSVCVYHTHNALTGLWH